MTTKAIDMTGQTFGKLTVTREAPRKAERAAWYCDCDCGKKDVIITGKHLRNGHTKSCGCLNVGKKPGSGKKLDLTGQVFERLTVKSKAPKIRDETAWFCNCVCGVKNVAVKTTALRTGDTRSCGCLARDVLAENKLKLVGQKFNRLTVVSQTANNEHQQTMWSCDCDCGTKNHIVRGSSLKDGEVKSCGCLFDEKKLELTGQKFGRLLVKETLGSKDGLTMVRCDCDCGTVGFVTAAKALNDGNVKSCGCLWKDVMDARWGVVRENLKGQKFGRLEVLELLGPKEKADGSGNDFLYRCRCECGMETVVKSVLLKNGHTKSCGCLAQEKHSQHGRYMSQNNTIYTPLMAAARQAFDTPYQDGDLTFEDFYALSQLPCFYCNLPPSNKAKLLVGDNHTNAERAAASLFVYNGLDRLNSDLPHLKTNIITACMPCNIAKRIQSLDEYKRHSERLITWPKIDMEEHRRQSLLVPTDRINKEDQYSFQRSVKATFVKSYDDGDLTLKQFYQLSQLNCYYCGIGPSNHCNMAAYPSVNGSKYAKETGSYYYNGLDRVDNDLLHDYENCVACCADCNYAKWRWTLAEFYGRIARLATHFETWKEMSERDVIELALKQMTN